MSLELILTKINNNQRIKTEKVWYDCYGKLIDILYDVGALTEHMNAINAIIDKLDEIDSLGE